MHLDNKYDLEDKYHLHFDEFFLKFMKEKFKLEKILKKNIEQTVMSIIKYSSNDPRIESSGKFLGIGNIKLRTEILDLFLILLKNIPVSFFKLFDDYEISDSFLIPVDTCVEIYMTKFFSYKIYLENFEKMIKFSKIFKNEHEVQEDLGKYYKTDIYYLQRYYIKSRDAFESLLTDFKSFKSKDNYTIEIIEHLIMSNIEFDISLSMGMDILKRNFKFTNDVIILDSFFDFFLDIYLIKIKVLDFVQISLECFCAIYSDLDRKLYKMWQKVNLEKDSIMLYKDFENALVLILGNNDDIWKFTEYFK